jgi:glycosyltransferase involved in cell wall biosynthesis
MKKYKVLILSPFPPPFGGIASYADNLFKGLVEQKINVEKFDLSRFDHLRFSNPDQKRNYIRILNPRNFLFISLIILDYFLFIIKILFKKNLVIHIHTSSFFGWWRSALFVAIARLFGKKTILHVHNAIDRFYINESGKVGKFLIRLSLRLPDEIISLSDGIKKLLSSLTDVQITPIYNGVDTKKFLNQKEYSKPYKMLFAGFVGQAKGVGDIMKALKKANLSKKDILLTIMGGGDIDEMKQLRNKLGLDGQVKFTGRISEDEKIAIFKSHHIFTLPSYGEGQPISILEGMASGMAILSTNVGSIPEIIKKENGKIVNPGDIDELARAITMFTFKSDLSDYGKINEKKAINKFSFSRVIRDNINIYQRCSSS